MKQLILFLSIGLLFLIPYSCSEDSLADPSNTMQGKFMISIISELEHGECNHDDFEMYLINEESNQMYTLEPLNKELKDYLAYAGKLVSITGIVNTELKTITSIENIIILSDQVTFRGPGNGNGGGGNGGGGNGGGDGTSNVSILVIMISDANTTPTCTEEDMVEQIIGETNDQSISNYYATSSKGAFVITDVTTTSVTVEQVPCYIANLSYEIDPLVEAQGFDLSAYSHIMYVSEQTCPYGGRAELAGTRFHTDYCSAVSIAAHELGHNLGLMHSSYNGSEYGDTGCVMGIGYAELNAPHRDNLDWMASSIERKSGTYSLSPLETDSPTEDQIIKVKIRRNHYYYFSYRAAIGPFQTNLNYIDHLSIHSWSGEFGLPTQLEALVAEGETYTNASDDVTVSNVEIVDGVLSFTLAL